MTEVFRRATTNDLLCIETILENTLSYMKKINLDQWDDIYPSLDILKNDILKKEMYLLEIDNCITAFVVLNSHQDKEYTLGNWQYSSEAIGVIHRLCVNPSHHNKGIGRKVLKASEAKLKDLGFNLVRLDVFSLNHHAINLYEKAGYQRAGVINFRKGDFYLMEKLL